MKAGLAGDDTLIPPAATAEPTNPCEHVSFSRGLKYGESDQNVLDVATSGEPGGRSSASGAAVRGGRQFAGDNATPDPASPMQDEAMCFAVRNGMVGVKIKYRLAPANPWPSGAKDVAAATSWVHQNIDLFGGPRRDRGGRLLRWRISRRELLAHPELQATNSNVAAAVLVSGIYRAGADASPAEKSYFGSDASKYEARSAFPGILDIETPLLLAWSEVDPPRLVAQGEKLKEMLCHSATHCPHTAILSGATASPPCSRPMPRSASLAQPTLELVREIETRGCREGTRRWKHGTKAFPCERPRLDRAGLSGCLVGQRDRLEILDFRIVAVARANAVAPGA